MLIFSVNIENMNDKSLSENLPSDLRAARDEFISQWGAMGSAWGINRTMAQIHALLMVSADPLTTDDIMAELQISRGNANTNLRELVGWGLLRTLVIRGERKEYFEAEKDVWRIFCTVTRQRKRREIEPILDMLDRLSDESKRMKGRDAKEFHGVMKGLQEFVTLADTVMERVARSEEGKVIPYVVKTFGRAK